MANLAPTLYCPVTGTPQTEAEVRTALDATPPARRQQLHELLERHHGHREGWTGEVEADLYGLIREWPRWAMGGDNCVTEDPAEYDLKRDFHEWWEVYGLGGSGDGGSRPWWERIGDTLWDIFRGDGAGSLPPGSEARIWGVAPGTLALLVAAVVGVYLWSGRAS